MTLIDWIIVAVVAATMLGGLTQGFFRSVFGLAGLLAGVAVGAWNYHRVAVGVFYLIHSLEVAEAISFILISLTIMGLAAILGVLLSKTAKHVGLGCLDRLAGAVFGFFQGILLVTLGMLVMIAFFPGARILREGRLPPLFFGACHMSTNLTPQELARKVRVGLDDLEGRTPQWMHPGVQ